MTTISVLSGDFEILFADETVGSGVTGMRMIRRASGATATVYTTLALYSDVAANADAFQAMGFRNPMLPTTPNEFTLENQYFMPRSSTEWLKEGTIKANWSFTASPDTDGNGVVRVPYSGGTGPVTGDVGRLITQGDTGDTGTLLDFETEPDGTTVAWVRPTDSTPGTGDTFDGTGTMIVTGGTMSTTASTAGTIGATQYTAFQAIGSVPTSTEVYIFQNRLKVTDYEGNFQWWTTDPTQSLGIISVLLRTETQGILEAKGDVEVFARRYTSLYDNFRLNVAAGGFAALPLASAADINNTTGYRSAAWNSGTGTAMQVGDLLTNTTTSGSLAVVTAVSDSGTTGTFEYYLVGTLVDFVDTNTFTSPNRNGTINGAPAANTGGPTDATAAEGGTVTIVAGDANADHDGDGTNEAYAGTVDAQGPGANGVPVAKVYERIKYVCGRGQTTDLFTGMNQPGESYRGAETAYFYDNPTGTMTETDDLTSGTGDWTARLMSVHTTTAEQDVAQAFVVVTDQQTSLDSMLNDYFIIDEGADQVQMDTGGAGGTPVSLSSPKSSPFGTFTGSQLFGAPAILFTGQADDDTQAYTLTDATGNLRVSPNTVTFAVENTVSGDRVYAARDTGVAGIIDKDQFGGLAAPAVGYNQIGDYFLRVGTAISTDPEVPDAAWVRVIENTLLQEHRYKYFQLDNTNEEFDLVIYTGGTAAATTSDTLLVDSSGAFVAEGVEAGLLIYVAARTSTYEVVSVTNATTLVIRLLYGAGGFVSTDTYTMNALIQTYAATDDIHDLILDVEATGTTTSNTFIKTTSSPFGVVVNVRNGKNILPFTQNQTVGDNGATVTTVRQPDTIAV